MFIKKPWSNKKEAIWVIAWIMVMMVIIMDILSTAFPFLHVEIFPILLKR
jgi:hypothetical protein